MSPPTSSPEPFPFLQLPLDVRVMIYRYLVPNEPSSELYGAPQRLDGPCHPSILAVSRDVRKEVLPEWYHLAVQYRAKVDHNGVRVLGHKFAWHEYPPLAFYRIKSLCLDVKLEMRPQRQDAFRAKVAQIVPPNGALKELGVHLEMLHPRYAGMKGTPDELHQALKRTLLPLQSLADLQTAKLECNIIHHITSSLTPMPDDMDLQLAVKDFFSIFEVTKNTALQL